MIRLLIVLLALSLPARAEMPFLVLASTTSTQNSGLYDQILPLFTKDTGIDVRVVAVGTGQALRIARNGDADALMVHHRPSEDTFVAEGYGIERRDIMYNDFILAGPADDPADIATASSVTEAIRRIARSGALFASRGDDSGTHKKEQEIWRAAGLAPTGNWYLETGSGMGATLNLAAAKSAYTLTDRGTWITFGNKGPLRRLFGGDWAMFNPYGFIIVNPERFPHAKSDLARTLSDWLVSERGQAAIAGFEIDGFQAFCPNAQGADPAPKHRPTCPAETRK